MEQYYDTVVIAWIITTSKLFEVWLHWDINMYNLNFTAQYTHCIYVSGLKKVYI